MVEYAQRRVALTALQLLIVAVRDAEGRDIFLCETRDPSRAT